MLKYRASTNNENSMRCFEKMSLRLCVKETLPAFVAIATQQIENYVSIARNLYRKFCCRHYQRKSI